MASIKASSLDKTAKNADRISRPSELSYSPKDTDNVDAKIIYKIYMLVFEN